MYIYNTCTYFSKPEEITQPSHPLQVYNSTVSSVSVMPCSMLHCLLIVYMHLYLNSSIYFSVIVTYIHTCNSHIEVPEATRKCAEQNNSARLCIYLYCKIPMNNSWLLSSRFYIQIFSVLKILSILVMILNIMEFNNYNNYENTTRP